MCHLLLKFLYTNLYTLSINLIFHDICEIQTQLQLFWYKTKNGPENEQESEEVEHASYKTSLLAMNLRQ